MKRHTKKQGFTLVEIVIAVSIVMLLSALSIHGLLRARMTANEAAAIRNLRTLHTAFASYRIVNPAYPKNLAGLNEQNPPYVDVKLAQGTKQGYSFSIEAVTANTFRLAAVPVSSGVTGNRSFFVDQSGEIFELERLGASATGTPSGDDPSVSPTPTPRRYVAVGSGSASSSAILVEE